MTLADLTLIPMWGGLGFLNLLGKNNSLLESLHDLVMVWLVVILGVVILVWAMMWSSSFALMGVDSLVLESMWTVLPMLVLISIAFPSLHLLCLQDSPWSFSSSTVKIVANQWNWQSQLEETNDHVLDVENLDQVSLYETPWLQSIQPFHRVMVTSSDVLHSLGVPSMGVKVDAMPGRVNTTMMEVSSGGLLFGSCYELCGSGHSIMPIYLLCSPL